MNVEIFKAEHLKRLRLQIGQGWAEQYLTDEYAEALERDTQAFTCFVGDRIIGCCGWLEFGPHRALLWSFIDESAGRHMVALHRSVKLFLDAAPYKRIEAEVDVEFEAGHRWIKMLGFECEAPRLRAHRPDGGDSALYARIK